MSKDDVKTTADYWDTVADNIRSEVGNELWRRHADFLNGRLLKKFLPDSLRCEYSLKTDMFDESLGKGLYSLLAEKSRIVTGMDISLNIVQYSMARNREYLGINANIKTQPYANNSFDLIVSTSTLDHFQSDAEIETALEIMADMLKPGGHLVWTMDNPANPIVWFRNILSRRFGALGFLVPYQMGRTWGLGRMKKAAGRLGLEATNTSRMMHCPRILVIQYLELLKKINTDSQGKTSLKLLRAMEILEKIPTRPFTAHYNALHAVKKT